MQLCVRHISGKWHGCLRLFDVSEACIWHVYRPIEQCVNKGEWYSNVTRFEEAFCGQFPIRSVIMAATLQHSGGTG